MLAVVTLYNSVAEDVANNINSYIDDVDCLIIWDNSPLEIGLYDKLHDLLQKVWEKVIWHGTGENTYIAPALNYSWKYAVGNKYDLLLIMDHDSKWTDFPAYRKEIEAYLNNGISAIYTPFIKSCDFFEIKSNVQEKHFIINSGMVIPINILSAIGGVDDKAFPLDAIDNDIAFSVRALGYKTLCLTRCNLIHKMGDCQNMGLLKIKTPNYNPMRIYSIVRAQIICYRKHRKNVTGVERRYLYKEILVMTFLRIILAEPNKIKRLRAYAKGMYDGLTYKINRNAK